MIKENDIVKVINKGLIYPCYDKWSGLKGYEKLFNGDSVILENEHKVIRVQKHDDDKDILALIQDIKTNRVYIVSVDGLEFVKSNNKRIIIEVIGNKVIATDESTNKKGTARCNPIDKFDFSVGAKLALDRLIESEREIKIGDMVKIVNIYMQCARYNYWSGLNGYKQNFVEGKYADVHEYYKVLNIKKDDNWNEDTLVLIQNPNTTQVFIIDIEGIEKVNKETKHKEESDEIKIGNIVEAINDNFQYTTYYTWNGLKGYEQNFVYNGDIDINKKYKVLNIEKHEWKDYMLALVQDLDTTQVFIMDIKGLKKIIQ